jgi:hypothetical protein
MPLIPMKQTIILQLPGTTDDWGETIPGERKTYKCRLQEGTKLVRATTNSGGVHGVGTEEVVSSAQVYLDKLVDVPLDATLEYTDENGKLHIYHPISIEVKRGLNGKALMTIVNV